MKTLEFIYQENEIHFLLNPNDDKVFVNATELGKLFNKEPKDFLRLDGTKRFIDYQLKKNNIVADVPRYIKENIYYSNNKAGTFMIRKLALKFAVWLDVELEDWVFDTIDKILYGNLKEYRDGMKAEIEAKEKAKQLKQELIANPGEDTVTAYFENEDQIKNAQSKKAKAVRLQKTLFEQDFIKTEL